MPFAFYKYGADLFKTKKLKLHIARSALGAISLCLYFFAFTLMSLNEARAIVLFYPIVGFIFAIFFAGEKVSKKEIIALLMGLVGGYFIIKPSSSGFNPAAFLVMAAIIMWAVIDLIIKKMSKSESTIKQLAFLTGFLSLFSFPFAIFNWKQPSNEIELVLLITIGFLFLLNVIAVFLAIKYANLTVIMPFDFSGLIFTAVFSYLFFTEIISLNIMIGSVIIFFSSLYLIFHQKNLPNVSCEKE